jgi:hypothetical protein
MLHTDMPLGSERSSGSAVRLPVITTLLMLVAATAVLPFGWFLCAQRARVLLGLELSSLEMPADRTRALGAGDAR